MGEFTLHLFLRCKQYKKYFVDAEARENLYKNPEISRELSQEAISEVRFFSDSIWCNVIVYVFIDKIILFHPTPSPCVSVCVDTYVFLYVFINSTSFRVSLGNSVRC